MSYTSRTVSARRKQSVVSDSRELRLQIQIITSIGLLVLAAGIVIEQVILR